MYLNISEEAFNYLLIQRGEVYDAMAKGGVDAWTKAYHDSLDAIFRSIASVLPDTCTKVLDVGSGLGGIDIYIARYYSGCGIHLLDGIDCPPVVRSHAKPFSNAEVARAFHVSNGSKDVVCIPPFGELKGPYDLIVSFAAYAFHIPPGDYLDDLIAASHDKTVFIFDVRTERRDWLEELCLKLGKPKVLERGKKHVRLTWTGTRTSSSLPEAPPSPSTTSGT